MHRIVFATANSGKLRELNEVLGKLDVEILPQSMFELSPVEESGLSFVENAILKARHAAQASGLPALADDSGLVVDVLEGAPGIRSARYAGSHASDAENCEKLLLALEGVPERQRTARFECVIVYLAHSADPSPLICEGRWDGRILLAPQGEGGFGYDPVFYAPEYGCSAAELAFETKNAISHRGQALRKLLKRLSVAGPKTSGSELAGSQS